MGLQINPRLMLFADPSPIAFDPARTALLIIDMQRDFLEPGGFGAMLGNDVKQLACVISPLKILLNSARDSGMRVIHTREGHKPDLAMHRAPNSNAAYPDNALATSGRWGAS